MENDPIETRKLEGRQVFALGPYEGAVRARQKSWADTNLDRRIWQRDGTVWVSDPGEAIRTPELTNRLGWLTIPEAMYEGTKNLIHFADEIRKDGFAHVVLLGMGGSSLAPEVFMETFGNASGHPSLIVLDSTPSEQVRSTKITCRRPSRSSANGSDSTGWHGCATASICISASAPRRAYRPANCTGTSSSGKASSPPGGWKNGSRSTCRNSRS